MTRSASRRRLWTRPSPPSCAALQKEQGDSNQLLMNDSTKSALALSFDEALSPSRLLQQMTLAAEHQVRSQIAEHGNRALGLALASAKFVMESGTMQVVFEDGIPAGAKLMKAAGKVLPALVDGKTGRILKWGSVASKARTVASVSANAALIVVEVAHLISGYDNAQRLKGVERSVDRLVHAHESELKSRLEAVYRYSKEVLHHGPGALSDEDRRELHRQCKDLMELRARWRDDFRHRISKIDPADPGFWNKLFWWRREDAHQQSRQSKAKESVDALEIIELMHFSLMLQMALMGSAGKMESFRHLTLPDECQAWRSLAEFGRKRVSEIAGDAGKEEFRHFLNALDDLADYWTPKAQEPSPKLTAVKKVAMAKVPKKRTKSLTPPKRWMK
jgi:hypothetical protein